MDLAANEKAVHADFFNGKDHFFPFTTTFPHNAFAQNKLRLSAVNMTECTCIPQEDIEPGVYLGPLYLQILIAVSSENRISPSSSFIVTFSDEDAKDYMFYRMRRLSDLLAPLNPLKTNGWSLSYSYL